MLNPKNFETMIQFANISKEAQEVVNIFNDNFKSLSESTDRQEGNSSLTLCTSLYATRPEAKTFVLEILKDYIVDLNDILTTEQIEILKSDYINVILNCSDFCISGTPTEISSDICLEITECEPNSSIYLPHNGIGNLSYKLEGFNCEGFEENSLYWAISAIRHSATGVEFNIECSATYIEENTKEYDYIFTYPSHNISNERKIKDLIHFIKMNLKENGELLTFLPLGICYVKEAFELRQLLAKLNMSIRIRPYQDGPFYSCIFYAKKDKQARVILSDAETGEKWTGTYSDLTQSLSLLPKRYLPIDMPTLLEGEQLVKLGDLIKIAPKKTLSHKAVKPVIAPNHLYNNYLNCNISSDKIKENAKEVTEIIDNNCLISCYFGYNFKVGRFDSTAGVNSISIHNRNTYAFVLSSNIVTEEFLLRALLSNLTKKQVKKYSQGNILHFEDFCEIMIQLPSIEEQQRICHEEASQAIKEAEIRQKKSYEDYRKDIHMKKHALGQTVANLGNWGTLLNQVLPIIGEETTIGKRTKIYVKDIFENIQNSISKLSIQLNKFDRGHGFVKENICLTEFIERYIQKNKSPLFRFEYDSSKHWTNFPDVDEDMHIFDLEMQPFEYAKFSNDALMIIFDNIVSNACSHGFAGRENEDNIIKITLESVDTNYVISIYNNGKPLDENVSSEDVMTYGHTSGNTNTHFGIGGYEIKRLMEEFGETVEIVSEPEGEFPVCYKLTLSDTGRMGIRNISELKK